MEQDRETLLADHYIESDYIDFSAPELTDTGIDVQKSGRHPVATGYSPH